MRSCVCLVHWERHVPACRYYYAALQFMLQAEGSVRAHIALPVEYICTPKSAHHTVGVESLSVLNGIMRFWDALIFDVVRTSTGYPSRRLKRSIKRLPPAMPNAPQQENSRTFSISPSPRSHTAHPRPPTQQTSSTDTLHEDASGDQALPR